MSYQFNIRDMIILILAIILSLFFISNSVKSGIIDTTKLELETHKNDAYAKANQDIQQSMRAYRSCGSQFIYSVACMDKEQNNIAEAKKLIKNNERYYRIPKDGTGYIDVHADAIIDFMN